MDKPNTMMMWRASEKLAKIFSTEYLLGGSSGASLWSLGDNEFDKECANLNPGSLVLIFRQDDKSAHIIGGAYFLTWRNFDLKTTWELYGVNNGAYDYDDFVHEVELRGGNANSTLSVALLAHTFMFEENDAVLIPDEFCEFLGNNQVLSVTLDEPIGRYLHSRVLERRDNYIGSDGADWRGMNYAASHRNSKTYGAEFSARVLNAYDFQCAISGYRARPVLSVAHIQPFYDNKFQKSSNGVVLRSDLYQLFRAGYITIAYTEDGEHMICRVSKAVRAAYGEDYMVYDGREVKLPANRSEWPEPSYVKWHNQNCFEKWMRINGKHPARKNSIL